VFSDVVDDDPRHATQYRPCVRYSRSRWSATLHMDRDDRDRRFATTVALLIRQPGLARRPRAKRLRRGVTA
jgi:hypothetical protein